MKIVESNKQYLRDASVAQMLNGDPLVVGCPTAQGAFAPEGEWLVATRAFHLEGGWGQGWEDPGVDVKAGQMFRLRRAGSPSDAAIWEIA